ncbi:MAG: hypothetical protein ACKODK_03470, partial [Opitutaceae bacterium]
QRLRPFNNSRFLAEPNAVRTGQVSVEGRLKGVTTGVAARYTFGRERPGVTITGVQVLPPIRSQSYILTNPFVSYRRKFGRFNWTLRLNVNNAFDEKIDIGNGYGWTRYTEPRQYVTTATVAF